MSELFHGLGQYKNVARQTFLSGFGQNIYQPDLLKKSDFPSAKERKQHTFASSKDVWQHSHIDQHADTKGDQRQTNTFKSSGNILDFVPTSYKKQFQDVRRNNTFKSTNNHIVHDVQAPVSNSIHNLKMRRNNSTFISGNVYQGLENSDESAQFEGKKRFNDTNMSKQIKFDDGGQKKDDFASGANRSERSFMRKLPQKLRYNPSQKSTFKYNYNDDEIKDSELTPTRDGKKQYKDDGLFLNKFKLEHDLSRTTGPVIEKREQNTFKSNLHLRSNTHFVNFMQTKQNMGLYRSNRTLDTSVDLMAHNQKSADQIMPTIRKRTIGIESNFGKSNVFNNEKPRQVNDGNLHHAITTRHENKWLSQVFGEPMEQQITGNRRRQIYQKVAGKQGIYGDANPEPNNQKNIYFVESIESMNNAKYQKRPAEKSIYEKKKADVFGKKPFQCTNKENDDPNEQILDAFEYQKQKPGRRLKKGVQQIPRVERIRKQKRFGQNTIKNQTSQIFFTNENNTKPQINIAKQNLSNPNNVASIINNKVPKTPKKKATQLTNTILGPAWPTKPKTTKAVTKKVVHLESNFSFGDKSQVPVPVQRKETQAQLHKLKGLVSHMQSADKQTESKGSERLPRRAQQIKQKFLSSTTSIY